MAKPAAGDSETRLLTLLQELGLVRRGGRPRGAPRALWSVVTQAPDPEQPWALYVRVHERDVAEDEIAALRPREGTLALLLEGPRPVWLGVADIQGEVKPVPPNTEAGAATAAGWPGWVEIWEGRQASAAQMISLCWAMEPSAPILATCACAAIAASKTRAHASTQRALTLARRWAQGEDVATADLSDASREAFNAPYDFPQGTSRRRRQRDAAYAAMYAADAAEFAASGKAWTGACRSALLSAAMVMTDSGAKFAAVVREYVGLGTALAALLDVAE